MFSPSPYSLVRVLVGLAQASCRSGSPRTRTQDFRYCLRWRYALNFLYREGRGCLTSMTFPYLW